MYIGGSTLLSSTYSNYEKSKAQSLSKFVTFSCSGLAALLSGILLDKMGWVNINIVCLLF
ncbi:MAG: hypothetical protein RLZZ293_1325 [Pseudomonadota bacterium]|jgi:hypothetical protein